ncbi:tetratricopeptide repeat protein [Leptodesmis sichuanensis]|uniref:tetratricopeptide repeat protein n=1 Tax=Leptodesmis sichuanensis TaxID=2906798 RepID=UPI001F1D4280|nr:tetratricopeptide repeat protein [Leptodesmis sichuanensis]
MSKCWKLNDSANEFEGGKDIGMRRGGFVIGITLITSLLSVQGGLAQSASEYRQLGLSLREQERYPEAIAALKKSVELDPQNLSGRVLLGWTEHKAGQQNAAMKTLLESLRLNPFDVPTLNALGIVYLVSGKLDSAIATHGWAAILKPDNEIAYYNLSLAFERIQQYDWAIATAKEAAKLEPTNPHPLVALAIAHWGNRDIDRTKAAYRQAIAVDARYGDPGFLAYLNEAGFSADQIQRSRQVLEASR